MTAHKHLKQRIRERQAKTGEKYATARRHVLAEVAAPQLTEEPSKFAFKTVIEKSDGLTRLYFDVVEPNWTWEDWLWDKALMPVVLRALGVHVAQAHPDQLQNFQHAMDLFPKYAEHVLREGFLKADSQIVLDAEKEIAVKLFWDCINAVGWGYFSDEYIEGYDNIDDIFASDFETVFEGRNPEPVRALWGEAVEAAKQLDAVLCLERLRQADAALVGLGQELSAEMPWEYGEEQPEDGATVQFDSGGRELLIKQGARYRVRQDNLNAGKYCIALAFDGWTPSHAWVRFEDTARESAVALRALEGPIPG